MLIDCERCRFSLTRIFQEIDEGLYTYSEFSHMGKRFLNHHPYLLGEIDRHWNVYDRCDAETKLLHYIELSTQPWKYPDHPYGETWFSYLREAQAADWITDREIDLTIRRGFARPDLSEGNHPGLAARYKRKLKEVLGRHPKFERIDTFADHLSVGGQTAWHGPAT